MKKLLVILALLVVAGCGATGRGVEWDEPGTSHLETGPYVLLGGPGEALVAFQAPAHRSAQVSWRAVGQSAQGVVEARRDLDLSYARLVGLPSGPRIEYQVILDDAVVDSGSFRAGTNGNGETVRFVAFGDTRTNHRVHRSVIEAIDRHDFDFIIHTGDMVERGGKRDQWRTFFQIERPILKRGAILPSIGNHDASGRQYYERYFLLDQWARGQRYFVTDWGNLRLVAIDGGIECEKGCNQYAFARKALADGAAAGKLMVMFLHYPPYSSGAHGSHLGVRGPIQELAKTYGVELVISGHDHNYERTLPIDGTTYVVSGSAGAPIRPVRPRKFSAAARTEPHFVLVEVEGERMILSAINLRGETFDRYVIVDNVPM